jgi:hypothetical protein
MTDMKAGNTTPEGLPELKSSDYDGHDDDIVNYIPPPVIHHNTPIIHHNTPQVIA